MVVDVYATGHSIGNKDDRRSGCAVVLVARYPDGRVQERRMTFKLGSATINLAHMRAAWLGLMALRRRAEKVTLHTNSHYVQDMLVKFDSGRYKAAPSTNVEAVDDLRNVFQRVGDVAVEYSKFDGGLGSVCLALAKKAIDGTPSDSGTVEVGNDEAGPGGRDI